MTKQHRIEYSVRPVTRYIVARFESEIDEEDGRGSMGSEGRGEYDNEHVAYEVAYALAKADHDRMGWPLDDERIQYPEPPTTGDAGVVAA